MDKKLSQKELKMILERLKTAMNTKKINIKEFSKIFEVTYAVARAIFDGRKKITPELALEIEEKLNIDAVWLIFGKGDMTTVRMDLGENSRAFMLGDDFDALSYLEKKSKIMDEAMRLIGELEKDGQRDN